jgi:sugar phosphate isomerase/epimerase
MPVSNNAGYDVSFEVPIIAWDGHVIRLLPEETLRHQFQTLAEAGIHWCMLAGLHFEEPTAFALAEGAVLLRRLLDEFGLRVSSHHCLVPTFAPIGESQTTVQEKLKHTVEICSLLQPQSLVLHPGRIAGYHASGADINAAFEAEERRCGLAAILATVAANLQAMARTASDFNVTVALENIGRFEPLGDETTLPDLVERVAAPNLGYCIDSGHAHAFGQSVSAWLRQAGSKLFETHFHDNHARGTSLCPPRGFVQSTRQVDEHLPVSFGTIDWIYVIQTLREIQYAGPVTFETKGWPGLVPVKSLQRAVDWWRACETLAAQNP